MEADFESQSSKVDSVSTSGLSSIAEIARKVVEKEAQLAKLEDEAKETKKALLQLTDQDLPAMLQEIGLTRFDLDDGSVVTVKPTYGGYIKHDNKEEAHQWLKDHGHDDLIKNQITVAFGRGEDAKATEFLEFATQAGHAPAQSKTIHPSTLKAWVKEQVENGSEFPMDLFGAFIGQRATIKRGLKK